MFNVPGFMYLGLVYQDVCIEVLCLKMYVFRFSVPQGCIFFCMSFHCFVGKKNEGKRKKGEGKGKRKKGKGKMGRGKVREKVRENGKRERKNGKREGEKGKGARGKGKEKG